MPANMGRHACLANPAQGSVCEILGTQAIKPHKVRTYLERRDPEFEAKMAQILCVCKEMEILKTAGRRIGRGKREASHRLLRRETRHAGDRRDGAGLAAET
jgi:hypothetical protein